MLLVRRGQPPLEGQWSLPGGVLELGEGLEEGLRREVLEETGLSVEPLALVEALSSIVREGEAVRYHYVILDYLCRVTDGTLACGSDASEAVWVGVEGAGAGGIHGLTAAAAAVIAKAFAMQAAR